MKKKYYILFLLLFCTGVLFADEVKFTASASKTTVGTGEQFQIDFSVNGNGENFNPPNINGFQLLSGPNMSTSMESINGATTVSTAYSYIIMAVKEGDFTIGPASIVVNGRKLSTNPIKIKVVKGRPVPQNAQAQSGPDNSINDAGGSTDLSKSLFIRAVVDKNTVYQGEQLTVNFRLYTRVGIEQSQADKLPDLNGFWNEDIKSPQQQVQWKVETYKGLRYNVADIKQTILFPEHAGNLTIDPLGMTFIVQIQTPAKTFEEQFFGTPSKEVKYKARSLPVVIHVKPLPEAGKPDGFTGAVGSFKIKASVDKTEVKANDPINYKVIVTGSGNIKLLKTLTTAFPADFEKYDPKIADTITETESGVSGSRIYNYLLIPRHQGDFTIDPLKFSYFNPATGRYVSLATDAFKVKVAKGVNESNVTAFSNDKQDVKVLDKDIRYIKTDDGGFASIGDQFYGSAGYILLILTGPVLCFAAVVYRNKMRRENADVVKVKSKKAGKIAAKHMANAQQQLAADNTTGFYEAVFRGLYGYLSDKLNISYADLNRETITAALKGKAVSDKVTGQLTDTLDICEMARYAPVTHISKQEVLDKAKAIINDIENEI